MTIVKTTEWETDKVRLVKLAGLTQSPTFPKGSATTSSYRRVPGRKITEVIVHQSAGPFREGIAAAEGIARFAAARPIYKEDDNGQIAYKTTRSGKRIPIRKGGGRGWPGVPYTFVIPAMPETVDGKIEVYRCWDDEWRTWHTGGSHNSNGVGVCVAGWYKSRWIRKDVGREQPDELAMMGLTALVNDYLLPRYGIKAEKGLFGHFDFGKPTCPGDFLEQWVRDARGEDVQIIQPSGSLDDRPLDTVKQRQQALIALGYDLGKWGADGVWGFYTRSALEAFQEDAGIRVDGVYGPQTDKAMRRALSKT